MDGDHVYHHFIRADLLPGSRERLYSDNAKLKNLYSISETETHLVIMRPLVKGRSLDRFLLREKFNTTEVIDLLKACLLNLIPLHDQGVIHRNLTPSTIIIPDSQFDRAKVVASGLNGLDFSMSLSHAELFQIVRFSSPEHLGSIHKSVSYPSDIYSLGLIMYECLLGKSPFASLSTDELLMEQLISKIPDIRSLEINVPPMLAHILQRMVRKDPEERYQSLRAILLDLAELSASLDRKVKSVHLCIGQNDVRVKLTRSSLAGMDDNLLELDTVLFHTLDGQGKHVILQGKSGSGKTRLLEEFSLRARGNNLTVLQGQGVIGSELKPYSTLSGVIKDVIAKSQVNKAYAAYLKNKFISHRETLLSVFPELKIILGEGQLQDLGPELMGEIRVLDSLVYFFKNLGHEEFSTLLILDDCQWSDPQTLKLFEHWFHKKENIETRGLSVIQAYRIEDSSTRLRIPTLQRSLRLKMTPLNKENLKKLARSMAGPLPDACVEHLAIVSAGNPFLAETELHSLVSNGVLIPGLKGWSLVENLLHQGIFNDPSAVMKRFLNNLEQDTKSVLTMGAVIGKRFSLSVLKNLSLLSEEEILLHIEKAEDRHLLTKLNSPNEFSFLHDKIRESFLSELDPELCNHYHLKLAQSLLNESPQDNYGLSFHFSSAGAFNLSFGFALKASQEARSKYALDLAQEHCLIAIKGLSPDVPTGTQKDLFRNYGEILMLKGLYSEGRLELKKALVLSSLLEDKVEILKQIAEINFKEGQIAEAVSVLKETLVLLGEKFPESKGELVFCLIKEVFSQLFFRLFSKFYKKGKGNALLPSTYNKLAYAFYFSDLSYSCWALLRQLNLAERFNPESQDTAQGFNNFSILFSTLPLRAPSLWASKKSLTIRTREKDLWGQGVSYHCLSGIHYVTGHFEDSIKVVDVATDILGRTGDKWEYNDALVIKALSLLRLGRMTEALQLAQHIFEISREIGDVHSSGFALEVWARATGGQVPAEHIRIQLQGLESDVMTSTVVLEAEALRLISLNHLAEAIRLIDKTLAKVHHSNLRIEYVVPLYCLLGTALRLSLESLPMGFNKERRDLSLRLKKANQEAYQLARFFKNNLPHVLREMALESLFQNRPEKAGSLFFKSLEVATKQGARYERAKTIIEMERFQTQGSWKIEPILSQDIRKELTEMGASFELNTKERPVTMALASRFSGILEKGKLIITATDEEKILDSIKSAVMHLFKVDVYRFVEEGVELDILLNAMENGFNPEIAQILPEKTIRKVCSHLQMAPIQSGLYLPIFLHQNSKGVVILGHSELKDQFGVEEVKIGEFIGALVSAALENAEAFSRIQDSVKVRDEFIELSSHELRTPLTSLTLQVGLMKRLMENPHATFYGKWQRLEKMIVGSEKQVIFLNQIVERLLSTTKLTGSFGELKLEKSDLGSLVSETLENMSQEISESHCPIDVDLKTPIVGYWDAEQLKAVIRNLLSNAFKYGSHKPVIIKISSTYEHAILEVEDFGVGIPDEHLSKIFDRFSRASSARHLGGLGLGLYLVQKIVEAHEGTVKVHSKVGVGTKFKVILPLKVSNL